MNKLGGLFFVFAPMSFLTIGGGQAIIAEVQRQAVSVHHWMTAAEFGNIFAISRTAPGPGSLFITLIGWHVAGLPGAAVASIAIFGPTIILTYLIASFWSRFKGARWQKALEQGLKPVAAGMILASVYVLLVSLKGAPWSQAIALAATAVMAYRRINPLILLASGGALFATAYRFFGA
jgi:chromate transporter